MAERENLIDLTEMDSQAAMQGVGETHSSDEEQEDMNSNINNSESDIGSDGDDTDDQPLVPEGGRKRKASAPVWKFAVRDGEVCFCNLCQQRMSCKDGSTSGISGHIKKMHPGSKEAKELIKVEMIKKKKTVEKKREKEDLKKKSQVSQLNLSAWLGKKQPISEKTKAEIDGALEDYIVADNEAFSTVENPFFRQFLFKLNSGYIAPSRQTVARKIDKKIDITKIFLLCKLCINIHTI